MANAWANRGDMVGRTTTTSAGVVGESFVTDYMARITAYSGPTASWQYIYAPTGDRIAKQNIGAGMADDNQWDLISDGDVLASYHKSGASEVFDSIYVSPGMDGRLARVDGTGAVSYFFNDALNSVHQISTAGGVTVDFNDAWGNPIDIGLSTPGGLNGRYSYTNRERDNESGLMHYRARSYDPMAGRFASRDPMDSTNLYFYVKNTPASAIDPSGKELRILINPDLLLTEQDRAAVIASKPEDRKVALKSAALDKLPMMQLNLKEKVDMHLQGGISHFNYQKQRFEPKTTYFHVAGLAQQLIARQFHPVLEAFDPNDVVKARQQLRAALSKHSGSDDYVFVKAHGFTNHEGMYLSWNDEGPITYEELKTMFAEVRQERSEQGKPPLAAIAIQACFMQKKTAQELKAAAGVEYFYYTNDLCGIAPEITGLGFDPEDQVIARVSTQWATYEVMEMKPGPGLIFDPSRNVGWTESSNEPPEYMREADDKPPGPQRYLSR